MKWMTVTAALVMGAGLNSADAGLFDCCRKKNDCCHQSCCHQAPQCCQPAPQPSCCPAPATTPCCAPSYGTPAPYGAPIDGEYAPLPPGEVIPPGHGAAPMPMSYAPQRYYYTQPREDKSFLAETWDDLRRFERRKNRALLRMIGVR